MINHLAVYANILHGQLRSWSAAERALEIEAAMDNLYIVGERGGIVAPTTLSVDVGPTTDRSNGPTSHSGEQEQLHTAHTSHFIPPVSGSRVDSMSCGFSDRVVVVVVVVVVVWRVWGRRRRAGRV
jgi:hypothetical protein